MTRSSWRLAAPLLALAAAAGNNASAAPALVDTLTCTAEVAPSATRHASGWKLSCAFEQAGTTSVQRYSGEITGLDQAERAAGKALLVWTVLAAIAPAETANLVGVYKTTNDAGLPAQSLIGGRDQTIVLQPIADGEQSMTPAVRLMQLELPKA